MYMGSLKDKILNAGMGDRAITDSDLEALLGTTAAARYGLVNKALKKQELIKIRRGLYVLGDKHYQAKFSKHFLASRIAPHSYVSLESALSYHGWIPEHVTTVSSMLALGRTKEFATTFGEFVFYQAPVNEYEFLTGVNRVEDLKNQAFLLAAPLRSLADMIYIKKIDDATLDFLITGLRISEENLIQLSTRDFDKISRVYRTKRVCTFLNNLRKELKK